MLKYLLIRVQDLQDLIRIRLETRSINDRLEVVIILFKEIHEFSPVVPHVYQHWLLNFFHEKLKLWIFRVGVRHVTEIFVTYEGMQQKVVWLNVQSHLELVRFFQHRQCHLFIQDRYMLENSILSL